MYVMVTRKDSRGVVYGGNQAITREEALRLYTNGSARYTFEEDIYIVFAEEAVVGYAYLASGKGYGGYIDILVGLEDETTLRGISIIRHSESPGLGAKITENEFRDQFIGLEIDDVELEYDGGQIDAITGATISSKAVADAVRTTAIEKIKEIFGGTGSQDG